MPLIIDGDNLLHVARGALEAERGNRAWLCRILREWAERTREQVTVVFDGFRPDSPGEGPLGTPPLLIRYSENTTADEIIEETVEASTHPARLVVISNDRRVRWAARQGRARSVDSDAFIAQVQKDLRRHDDDEPAEPREKFQGLEPGTTDDWLSAFGFDESE